MINIAYCMKDAVCMKKQIKWWKGSSSNGRGIHSSRLGHSVGTIREKHLSTHSSSKGRRKRDKTQPMLVTHSTMHVLRGGVQYMNRRKWWRTGAKEEGWEDILSSYPPPFVFQRKRFSVSGCYKCQLDFFSGYLHKEGMVQPQAARKHMVEWIGDSKQRSIMYWVKYMIRCWELSKGIVTLCSWSTDHLTD